MSVCFTMDIFVAWGPIISSTEHAQVQGRGGGKSQYRYCNTSRTESKSKLQFFSTILFPSRFLGPRSVPPCHQCAFGGLHTSETPPACHSTVYGVRGPSTTAAACTLHGICGLSLAAARTSHRIVRYHITSLRTAVSTSSTEQLMSLILLISTQSSFHTGSARQPHSSPYSPPHVHVSALANIK